MTKVAFLSLGLAFLFTALPQVRAQNSSAADIAVNEAVLRQANTIVLRQKLADARAAVAHGDLTGAAKLYEDAYELVDRIGSGIEAERAQTVSGLVAVRIELARRAQQAGDYVTADKEINRAIKVDGKNATALAFKKKNDAILAQLKGKVPDAATLERVKPVMGEKTDAATLVRDGKLLYEMGKLEEAQAKLNQALALDPDNQGAYYYLNLCKQTAYQRESRAHDVEFSDEMFKVQRVWNGPLPNTALPTPNPYALTNLIHTGAGRQEIVSKLNRIHIDNVKWGDGLPLSEVIRTLSEQCRIRDPEKKGINFFMSSAVENASPVPTTTGANGGPTTVDPATGLPVPAPTAAASAESVDVGSFIIKLNLVNEVRLADLLDAIVEVSDHPLKYSIRDYAIVFSPKGQEQPQLHSRHFKIDANTFYQGMESVAAISFAGSSGNSGGTGGVGGGGGGGGGNGGNGNNNVSSFVGVVNAVPGAGSARTSGNNGGGGGGGGGGGTQGTTANPLDRGGTTPTAGTSDGGIKYVTKVDLTADVSLAAKNFFAALGVNLDPPKVVVFNDRLGELFVRATEQDLDTIESAIEMLNQIPPQVHIKTRFVEVEQDDQKALGFDWYLGQFSIGGGDAVGTGGSSPSLTVPASAANPGGTVAGSTSGTFPGNTSVTVQPGTTTDQLITGGLRNALGAPALGTITGILTDPNFRVVLRALEQRSGFETLGAPEVTTTSGRQAQMRATVVQTVITGFSFQQGSAATTTTGTTTQ